MVRIVSFQQSIPVSLETVIHQITSHFGERVHLLEASENLLLDFENCKLCILILASNPHTWHTRLDQVFQKHSPVRTIALVDSKHLKHVERLLDTPINDIIVPPISQKLIIEKVERCLSPDEEVSSSNLLSCFPLQNGSNQFIGKSNVFLDSIGKIPSLSRVNSPVLIMGESGTGKELCARAIHYSGYGGAKPFVPINCATIPDSLFENELFGHEKGAFTDAGRNQRGLIEEAEGGTLFLDEVDSLTPSAQSKLLRFVEDKKIRPLGSTRYIDVNLRLICATNTNLLLLVKRGAFRKDLYYRISVLSVELPPLRVRSGDIVVLSDFFLKKFASLNDHGEMFLSHDAKELLNRHDWPGNVRELSNVIERAVCLTSSNIIRAHDLSFERNETNTASEGNQTFREAKSEAISNFEKSYLLDILQKNRWNISQSSQFAKKDRKSFKRLMKKHGITTGVFL